MSSLLRQMHRSPTPSPIRVPFRSGEPAYALFERLSRAMGCRSAHDFAAELNLSHRDILSGAGWLAVATTAGVPEDELGRATFHVDGKVVRLGGEQLDRAHWSCLHPRCCPICRDGDNAHPEQVRWHRSWWDVVPVRRCHIHGVRLVGARGDRIGLRAAAGGLDAASRDGERYVVGRLGFAPRVACDLLDRLPLSRAVDLMEVLGAGRRGARDPRTHDTAHLLSTGYANVAEGASSLLRHLDRLVATSYTSRDHFGPGIVYGRLYRWLASDEPDPAFAEIRALLRSHALAHVPLAPGQKLFGEVIRTQSLYTLAQAARHLGVQKPLARRMLLATGAAPAGVDHRREVFAAEQVGRAAALHRATMSTVEARGALGLSSDAFASLVAERCLSPVVNRRETGMRDDRFRQEDVSNLIDRLVSGVPIMEARATGTEFLGRAARASMSSTGWIVRAMLEGRVSPVGRWPSMPGLGGLLVPTRDVLATQAADARRSDLVSWDEVVRTLGRKSVADALVRSGHLTRSTTPIGFRNRRRLVVTRRQWSAFRSRFVSAAELAKEENTSVAALVRKLAASGIEPAFPAAGRRFFERRALCHSLAETPRRPPARAAGQPLAAGSARVGRRPRGSGSRLAGLEQATIRAAPRASIAGPMPRRSVGVPRAQARSGSRRREDNRSGADVPSAASGGEHDRSGAKSRSYSASGRP